MADFSERPKFSVIIPTHNCALSISWTLQTVEAQLEKEVEVILIDAGSTDGTLEVAQRAFPKGLRVYTSAEKHFFEMANRGISLARGQYVSILFPGDSYLSDRTFNLVGERAEELSYPELIYCGALRRDPGRDPELVYTELNERDLRMGHEPTKIQGCFYRLDAIRSLGKFDPTYRVRASLDLFCRFYNHEGYRAARLLRVLVDHDRPYQIPTTLLRRVRETLRIIHHHFGLRSALRWLGLQNHLRYFLWWLRSKKSRLWT